MKRKSALCIFGYICLSLVVVLATAASSCNEDEKVKEAENDLKGANEKLEEFDGKLEALNERRENLNDNQKKILDKLPAKKDKIKSKLDAAQRELEELKRFLESGESISRAQAEQLLDNWDKLKSDMACLSKTYESGGFPSVTAATSSQSPGNTLTAGISCDPRNIPAVQSAVRIALEVRTVLIAEGSYSPAYESRLVEFVLNTVEIETSEAFGRHGCS